MKNSDKLKRYSMFIEGVIFSALDISLITKAGLGTSPITSLVFVLVFLPKKLKKLKRILGQMPQYRYDKFRNC